MLRTEGQAHLQLILKWLKCRVKSRKLQLALPTLTSSTMHSKAIRLSHTQILPSPERLREEFSGRQEGRGVQHRDLQRAVLGIEPRSSRTRSENHATRPNSHVSHARPHRFRQSSQTRIADASMRTPSRYRCEGGNLRRRRHGHARPYPQKPHFPDRRHSATCPETW